MPEATISEPATMQAPARETMRKSRKIAYFITSHGFGHATRALAVMSALLERDPSLHFEIFSQIPLYLMDQSIAGAYDYHPLACDVGLAQHSALAIDIPGTLQRLAGLLPFREDQIRTLALQVRALRCAMVICDIAPMGIAVAKEAGLESVLIENFTWDWIYEGYVEHAAALSPYCRYHAHLNREADYRIQTTPVCAPLGHAFRTEPIAREHKMSREETRTRLGILPEQHLVMITMGGISQEISFLDRLQSVPDCFFLIPGPDREMGDRILRLPPSNEFFHPDLVEAADVVIGKLGYSTLAEVYRAGVPFGYVAREHFRESSVLAHFIREHMPGAALSEASFLDGSWLEHLEGLLQLPRRPKPHINGAAQAADFLLAQLST